MKSIFIQTPYITLGQMLKLSDCIQSGGQAKAFLSEVPIEVNEIVENRRGRKLYVGDRIRIQGFGDFRIH